MNQYPHCACHLSFSFLRFPSRSLYPSQPCSLRGRSLSRTMPFSLSTPALSVSLRLSPSLPFSLFSPFNPSPRVFLPLSPYSRWTSFDPLSLSQPSFVSRAPLCIFARPSLFPLRLPSVFVALYFLSRSRCHSVRFIDPLPFRLRTRSFDFLPACSERTHVARRSRGRKKGREPETGEQRK